MEIQPTPDHELDTGMVENEKRTDPKSPVLVIQIQSWATPVAAMVMFIAGLLLGYYLPRWGAASSAASPSATTSAQTSVTPSGESTQDPGQTAEDAAYLMKMLVAQTRWFQGNPDAKVTIIEFGDFQ